MDTPVPCGRCPACRINRAEDWTHRMYWEADYFQDVSFLTLTYADEFIPWDGSLDRDAFPKFIRSLRKRFLGRKMKYFACGEYGERYGRPHYHAVVFGLSSLESQDVLDCWGKGQVEVTPFKLARARYVAGYLLKEVDSRVDLNCKVPPFALMSKGLGKRFAVSNAVRILTDGKLTINGEPVALPRYFRKLLDIDLASNPEMKKMLQETYRVHLERSGEKSLSFKRRYWAIEESVNLVRKQVGLNQKSWESVKAGRLNGL
ncbi:MAG: replication initiator protein [Microvirus sp.]|nr:MAG: replication initiator protein [Microvirus sp.]